MKKINTILIIDDCEADHIIAKFAIEEYDDSITIFNAYDGQEALILLETMSPKPDLIFLDINMPGMNGHEFLAEYAKTDQPVKVIAMLTSSSQPTDKEKCLSHPFVQKYLTKPLETEDLITIAENL